MLVQCTKPTAMVDPNPTILLAEDSDSDTMLIQIGFEDAGLPFSLHFVPDGLEAVEYLSGKGIYRDKTMYPPPCMLVTDLKMPRMDGFELLAWVRSHEPWKELPVIILSGSEQVEDKQRAGKLGANDYVVKGLLMRPESALFRAIRRHAPRLRR
ncbi:MAG TPA: response regulator [Candidatus Dormibacteraeota bacterium]|nr:response regulator [Candidatus Dormibacteraeota bacterium]